MRPLQPSIHTIVHTLSVFCAFLAAAGLLLFSQGCAKRSKEDAKKILDDMVRATSKGNFVGVKSFEQKMGGQTFRFRMKISHAAPDLTRLEFLEPHAKQGQVVVTQGKEPWRLDQPDSQPVHFKRFGSYREMEIRNMKLLLQNYNVQHLGSEQIAKRMADVIQICSRARPQIVRKIWVDKASRLPLKSEETSGNGTSECNKRFYYEQIQFVQSLPMNLFSVSVAQGSRSALPQTRRESITLEEAKRRAPFAIALPQHLPQGFLLQQIHWVGRGTPFSKEAVSPESGGEGPPSGFLHFHYSDGLRAISLFEEGSESFLSPAMAMLEKRMGNIDRVYRLRDGTLNILHRHRGGTHATLVGELSYDDLIRMISSLQFPRNESNK